MRALVILGHWGEKDRSNGIDVDHKIPAFRGKNVKTTVFNGGNYNRLRGIMSVADGYDTVFWQPSFDNGCTPLNPYDFVDSARTQVLCMA